MKSVVTINGRKIGSQFPPYIVAEMSANHNGDIQRACKILEMAKTAGADAVKLQTYTADTLTIDCDLPDFQLTEGLWAGNTLYNLYKQAAMPWECHKPLFDYARKLSLTLFSTPFDETAVDLLEDLNVPAYKIASFEAIDIPLISYVAQTGKPMIVSTGMANLEEITEVVEVAKEKGCQQLVLLHCVSGYPVPAEQSNLRVIPDLSARFNVPVGLSDHSLGTTVSIASVALGACLIEKHVTLNRQDGGVDSAFSLEPDELTHLCTEARQSWLALGDGCYEARPVEQASIRFRRSIYVIKDIKQGESFSRDNVRIIRPGFGMKPKAYAGVLGRRASRDIQRGEPLSASDIVCDAS